MLATNLENIKLGGLSFIVQIYETILHYKCKSHRGRSSTNITGDLCMGEVRTYITGAFTTEIENKKKQNIMPVIALKLTLEVLS